VKILLRKKHSTSIYIIPPTSCCSHKNFERVIEYDEILLQGSRKRIEESNQVLGSNGGEIFMKKTTKLHVK